MCDESDENFPAIFLCSPLLPRHNGATLTTSGESGVKNNKNTNNFLLHLPPHLARVIFFNFVLKPPLAPVQSIIVSVVLPTSSSTIPPKSETETNLTATQLEEKMVSTQSTSHPSPSSDKKGGITTGNNHYRLFHYGKYLNRILSTKRDDFGPLCKDFVSCVFPTPALQFQRASVRFIYGEMFRADRRPPSATHTHTHGFVAGSPEKPVCRESNRNPFLKCSSAVSVAGNCMQMSLRSF